APRTAYAADITGHVLIQVLYEQVCRREIEVYEEFFAWQLVVNDDRCQGVICWDLLNGGLKTIGAKTVVVATGGAGRLYTGTTNAMELASRDVISRSEQTEIDEGRGLDGNVLLDLRHLGPDRIIERLPGTRELAMTFKGIDPIFEPIPVRPGAHYHMGGVDTDVWGQTELTGLYAAGEVACVSVHGANRLGGNALMETITFGKRAGRHAAEWALSNTTIEVPQSV